jgi:hypothetical protein
MPWYSVSLLFVPLSELVSLKAYFISHQNNRNKWKSHALRGDLGWDLWLSSLLLFWRWPITAQVALRILLHLPHYSLLSHHLRTFKGIWKNIYSLVMGSFICPCG